MAGSNVEEIKGKLDIVDFLKGYLKLQPAGKNFKALCPFHNEKTASFMISPERQSWHCFGCALGGDIFAFIMRYENIEFGEALKILAEKAGVELKYSSSPDYKFSGLLYEINDAAKKFYIGELGKFPEAQGYLRERGLADGTIEEFEVGWAPNGSEMLSLHLINLGYAPEDIVRAGLAFKSERGLQSDRFRGRIMFPIHNHVGKVVGFTGRIFPKFDDGTMGKYINSPETPIFNKSKLLYGFWKSKNVIREENSVFLVEGQMDFLMSYQAGIRNAVASSGTALTADHLHALRRLTDMLVLSFDNDEAGRAAGERAIDLAEAADFNVKVIVLDEFKDPADAIQNDSAAFTQIFHAAQPAPEFYFERYLKNFKDLSARDALARGDFKKNLRVVLGKVRNIPSPVEQNIWLKEFSRRLGLDESALREEAEQLSAGAVSEKGGMADPGLAGAIPRRNLSRRELLSEYLLAASLARNDFADIKDSIPHLAENYQAVFALLKEGKKASADPQTDALMNLVMLRAGEAEREEIAQLKQYLADEYSKEKREAFVSAVKRAEASGDEAAVKLALEEIHHHLQ